MATPTTHTNSGNGAGEPSGIDTLAPHNIEAEEGVLGSVLVNPAEIVKLANFLRPDDFFMYRNSLIYQAMLDIDAKNEHVDNLTISDLLKQRGQLESIGGAAYLYYLINNCPSSVYGEMYGRIVERYAMRRRLLQAANQIASDVNDGTRDAIQLASDAEQLIRQVTRQHNKSQIIRQRDAVAEWFEEINRRELLADNNTYVGIPTGYNCIDTVTGGLQRDKLTVFAARSEHGKSAFMINVMRNIARTNTPVGVISLEMSRNEIIDRTIAIETGLNTQVFVDPEALCKHQGLIVESRSRIDGLPIYYEDTPDLTMSQIESRIRFMVSEYGVEVVFIDHLGEVKRDENQYRWSKEQLYGNAAGAMKNLARKLHIHIWLLAQLNRQVYDKADKKPSTRHIRYSDEVMHKADIIWLWSTPCMFDEGDTEARPPAGKAAEAYLYSGKNRGGPKLDTAGVRFDYVLSSQKITEATLPKITFPGSV